MILPCAVKGGKSGCLVYFCRVFPHKTRGTFMLQLPEFQALQTLSGDGRWLFATRMVRMFAYGFIAIILGLYLAQVGLSDAQVGLVLSLTLLGDAAVSLPITIIADRFGRRRMLMIGAGLMVWAGVVVALNNAIIVLTDVAMMS